MRKLASIAQVSAEWRSKGSVQKSRVGDWTGLCPRGQLTFSPDLTAKHTSHSDSHNHGDMVRER